MLKKMSGVLALLLAVTALSACTSVQYSHYFKEGYTTKATSVFISAKFLSDQFSLNTTTFSSIITDQLQNCGCASQIEVKRFNALPQSNGRRTFSFSDDITTRNLKAVQKGKEKGADAVVVIEPRTRLALSQSWVTPQGVKYRGRTEEASSGYNIRYLDVALQEVIWSSDIYMNASEGGLRTFSKDEKAQNLSNAIFEHMAKDGIFADCVSKLAPKS